MSKKHSWGLALLACVLSVGLILGTPGVATARLTSITVNSPVVVDLPAFRPTGPYLKISGTFTGELDPTDPRNAVIADIALAPQVDDKVQYTSTFYILRPVDLSKGNGKMFYGFGNRGGKRAIQYMNDAQGSNDPSTAEEFGNGFLMRQGYIVAWNGWLGDVNPGPNIMSIDLPVAVNPGPSTITGSVVAERVASSITNTTIALPYAADPLATPPNGVLTVREHQTDPRDIVPVSDWGYDSSTQISFTGPAQTGWIYEFVYTAQKPKVMGMGHAATRDFLSFLKHAAMDDSGNPNPLAMPGGIKAIYSWGRSQGGRVERDFLYYGFNEDEDGEIVIDGMMPYATGAGGLMWMNFRFSQPTVSSRKHERHFAHEPEFPQTFPVMTDPLTGQTDGILARCIDSDTCPKFFNIDGGNEYWNKSSSLNHTDASGDDLDLETMAPDVRIYSIASIQHNTTFDYVPAFQSACKLNLTNPLYGSPVFRALLVALDEWVTSGKMPPDSQVPRKSDGTLVAPEVLNFPLIIPATAYDGWPAQGAVTYDPETMNRNAPLDFTVVPYAIIPGPEYAVQVSQTDDDGNDLGGIRLPDLAVPIATYTGWAVRKLGEGYPDTCGQFGMFIPFANTKAEREAAGDPRLSLEERYKNHGTYVSKVAKAANDLVKKRFLLHEDATAIKQKAAASSIGK